MFGKEKNNIKRGIEFLQMQQEKDGHFISLSFAELAPSTEVKQYHSIFLTALILDALNSLVETTQDIGRIKDKAASFLLSQKSEQWSFNYWKRNSQQMKTMPYPDDLDDTFCALSSLFRYDRSLIDGKAMAGIVYLLTANEIKEGGPYRTWLVSHDSDQRWQDVDIAVNSNIAYFLSLHDINLPMVDSFIEEHIQKEIFTSPYYPSVYPIIYFIARFYKGKYRDRLRQFLLAKRGINYAWENPLQTALAVSSLLNLGVETDEVKKSIAYLMRTQKNNSWSPYKFCIDPAKEGKTFYAGSSALTTAFCLEAIAKYIQEEGSSIKKSVAEEEKLYSNIIKGVEDIFALFDEEFKTKSLTFLQTLLDQDKSKQIPLLSYYFTQSLGERKKEITDELLVQLGIANVLGWIAYTIYDNFLDEEGDPVMLSIANVAHREFISIFESIFSANNEFRAFFHTVMNRMDESNAWEVTHCRIKLTDGKVESKDIKIPYYGKYNHLAHKSLGHGLGPIAILFSLGYLWDSFEIKSLVNFFEHHLIAKQLNDDAHDWEKDLKMGQVNPVCALLLKKIYATHIKGKREISLTEILPVIQKVFWNEVLDEVCRLIFYHTNKARIMLLKCEAIVDSSSLEELIVIYEDAARKALTEKEQTIQFVDVYTNING